jgi:hypothetical protein
MVTTMTMATMVTTMTMVTTTTTMGTIGALRPKAEPSTRG